jgi:hypothetical protein
MIAELLDSKASFAAVINYNERVVKKGKGEILSHHNMITFTGQERIKWLEDAAGTNTRIKYPVFHVAIAFDYGDELNNSVLDQIGHEYMEHMGYSDCSYVIYRHEDKKHTHIHVVGSRVDQAGKKVNDSFEQYKSESLCRNMEVKYQLRLLGEGAQPVQAPVSRIQSRIWDKEKPVFNRINNEVQFILKEYKPTDLDQFKALAKKHFIEVQERKDPDGKALGLVYAVIYEDGHRDHKGISGSSFRHDYSLNGLLKTFEKNAGRMPAAEQPAKQRNLLSDHDKMFFTKEIRVVYHEIQNNQLISEAEFTNKLSLLGVKPIFAKNSSGYYGISFQFPAKDDLTIKGSDLDKSLSYNAIRGRIIGEGNAEAGLLSLIGQHYKSTLKFHDLHEKPTISSVIVFLSRIGFKVGFKDQHFVLNHRSLTGSEVKISIAQMEKTIEETIILPGTVSRKMDTTGLLVTPFDPDQWKLMETLASNNTTQMLEMLQNPAFFKTKRLALHQEELRLFASQIRHIDQLSSFHARLLGSIRLIGQLSKKSPVSSLNAATIILKKAGISLFANRRGQWFLKDYQNQEVLPVLKYPLPEKDLKTFLDLLHLENQGIRPVPQSVNQENPLSENFISFELLAFLIKRDQKGVTDLMKQGITTNFTAEEMAIILGGDQATSVKGKEDLQNDWDKLIDQIEALADFFLYDSWRGIQDEDQLKSTGMKRRKRR